jgi:hypothetical protein
MPRRFFVRNVEQATARIPQVVIKRMVHDHPDEAAHDDRGIDIDEGTFALALPYVTAEKLVDAPYELVEEHLRELVFLERRVQQQSLKLGVVFVVVEGAERERFENGAIVLLVDTFGGHLFRFEGFAAAARFVVENGGVEFFLGGEMAKNHRFGDAGRLGNFFGGGTAKPAVGEETNGDPKYL